MSTTNAAAAQEGELGATVSPTQVTTFSNSAHIVCLPIEFGSFSRSRFDRGGSIGPVIGATYQNGWCGGQIEGHPALAWLDAKAPLTAAPI